MDLRGWRTQAASVPRAGPADQGAVSAGRGGCPSQICPMKSDAFDTFKASNMGGVVNLLGLQAELNETRVFVAIIYEKVKGCLKSIGETSSNNHILETLPIVTLWCFFAEKWWMCLTIPSLEMGGECQFYMICQSSKSPTGDEGTARWRSNC